MEFEITEKIWRGLKIFVFASLLITATVMWRLGNSNLGTSIVWLACMFLLFNKMDSIDRRIKELEDKNV
jgi:hypothetical protein